MPPSDLYLGGIVVSWVAFAIAMIGLYYAGTAGSLGAAGRSSGACLAAVFPFAFFYGAVYTEATFLAATVWTFYFFRTRRWLLGGLVRRDRDGDACQRHHDVAGARLDCVARSLAAATVGETRWRRGATGCSSVVGLAARRRRHRRYSLFVYQLSGHPFEWAATVQRWGYHPGGSPWLALVRLVTVLVTRPYSYLAAERDGSV